MAWLSFAYHSNDTLATYDLAVAAHFFDRCSYFHLFSPDPDGFTHLSAFFSISFQVGLLHHTVVLMRHHVRLNLRHEIHYHYNHDEQ